MIQVVAQDLNESKWIYEKNAKDHGRSLGQLALNVDKKVFNSKIFCRQRIPQEN